MTNKQAVKHYCIAPPNGVGVRRDYAYVRVNQWPMGLPSCALVSSSKTKPCH